jgi:hypothetical protein
MAHFNATRMGIEITTSAKARFDRAPWYLKNLRAGRFSGSRIKVLFQSGFCILCRDRSKRRATPHGPVDSGFAGRMGTVANQRVRVEKADHATGGARALHGLPWQLAKSGAQCDGWLQGGYPRQRSDKPTHSGWGVFALRSGFTEKVTTSKAIICHRDTLH